MSRKTDKPDDEIYGARALASALPKSHFPGREENPRRIYMAVRDELMLDGNSRQNLATFCQTWISHNAQQCTHFC